MSMMGGGAGAPGANPDAMKDMMKNPSFSSLMSNPEMLSSSVGMMKNNPAMLEMMEK